MAGTNPNNDVLGWSRVSKYLIDTTRQVSAGLGIQDRATPYGEKGVMPISAKAMGSSMEGSLYLTRTPTVGTGVASITTPTAFTDTSPHIIITNNNPVNGRDIYMESVKITYTVAGTAAADLQLATKLDQIARYSSGGSGGSNTGLASVLAGPYPTNSGAAPGSGALIYAGALVAVAGSSTQRVLENYNLRTTIMVARDSIIINYDGIQQDPDVTAIATATSRNMPVPHVGVTIAPGHSHLIYLWSTSQSAASQFEVVITHRER